MEEEEKELVKEGETVEKVLSAAKPSAKRKRFLIAAVILAVLVGVALFYFLNFGRSDRLTLATVNGEEITLGQFNQELEKTESPLRDLYREEPKKLIEGMIIKRVLLQEAKKQGLSVPPKTYKDAPQDSLPPEEALIAELMKKKFSTPPEVTRKEVENFYATFKERMEGKTLEQMAPVIEQIIQQGKQQQEVERYMGDLLKASGIDIHEERLKQIAAKPPESNTEEEVRKALQSGQPVLVDFGANSCVPCRQMRPILKELSKEYTGKVNVLVIDVYRYQGLAREYQIQLIPTLVFFDPRGKEVFRHVGAMEKEKISAKLREIGVGS